MRSVPLYSPEFYFRCSATCNETQVFCHHPVPHTQVLDSLFNYVLTNSEDRRFVASRVRQSACCLSVCLSVSLCQAIAVVMAVCGDVLEYCQDLKHRSEKPYQDEETAYKWTDSRSANNFTC